MKTRVKLLKQVFRTKKRQKNVKKTQKPSIFKGFSGLIVAEKSVDRVQRHGGLTLGHIHKQITSNPESKSKNTFFRTKNHQRAPYEAPSETMSSIVLQTRTTGGRPKNMWKCKEKDSILLMSEGFLPRNQERF